MRRAILTGCVAVAFLVGLPVAAAAAGDGRTAEVRRAEVGPVEHVAKPATSRAPEYHLDWWSVNSGGATEVSGSNYHLGASVGQAAAGYVAGSTYQLGVGFWYGASPGGGCPMTIFGDVDLGGSVTSGDIIYMVNFVFKGGPAPQPCDAAGDVDCSGSVTSGDIIYLVNFVFKGAAPPCNTCTSPLAGGC